VTAIRKPGCGELLRDALRDDRERRRRAQRTAQRQFAGAVAAEERRAEQAATRLDRARSQRITTIEGSQLAQLIRERLGVEVLIGLPRRRQTS
jgi:hypothetical protein